MQFKYVWYLNAVCWRKDNEFIDYSIFWTKKNQEISEKNLVHAALQIQPNAASVDY